MPRSKRLALLINGVLIAAIVVDLVLPLFAIFAPKLWFDVLHAGIQPDELHVAFLRRAAAHWAAFALVQVAALALWRRSSAWLLVTAGARVSDWLTDITYFGVAPTLSSARWLLILPLFLNVGMALVLLFAYKKLNAST